ncbi:MAG: bifunctional oligoribonuclease/PAP phosphatase NrnA [Acidobacteriota bacterium]
MTNTQRDGEAFRLVCEAIRARHRFVVTSHVRPDGDSIGSAIALAEGLRAIGKEVRVVNRDRAPLQYQAFPNAEQIEIAETLTGEVDAVIVLECGDLGRTGLLGLDGAFVLNIDHHPGNTGFGHVRWFDGQASACAEMVYAILVELGAPLSASMATFLYVAIVTDTGSFRYPGVSPRTFTICARLLEAGADPVFVARRLFDGSTLPRLRLQSMVMQTLETEENDRIAMVRLEPGMLEESGASLDDTDGLINVPLSVRQIQVVVFFKPGDAGQLRVSLRSKGDIDVGRIARSFGGGGHRNASGCTIAGSLAEVRALVLERVRPEVAASAQSASAPEPAGG